MQNNEIAQNVYDESNIQVLEGLEPVRLRPGMYIGSTDKRGLHHLVYEIVDNSIDEAMGGYCSKIIVNINKDGSVSITDDGRGIPCGIHPTAKISALEVALTKLHSGGKFDANSYKVSGGLHGVGLAVVNALSEHMTATIKREGKIHQQKYSRGETLTGVEIIGETEETGTKIEFKPDAQIFDSVDFEYDTLRRRLREMAFLNNGIDITLRDEREEPVKSNHYCYEGGLKSFVENLNRNKEPLTEDTIYIKSDDGTYTVELAMQYNEGYSENIHTYANNISTHEGGTHETGFRSALTKVINEYARKINVLKPADENLSGEDVREGLTAILSVKLPNPQFEGQTKTKLGNSRMRPIVDTTVTNENSFFFLCNAIIVIVSFLVFVADSAKHRDHGREARRLLMPCRIVPLVANILSSATCSLVGILLIARMPLSIYSPVSSAVGMLSGVIGSLACRERLGSCAYLGAALALITVFL